MRYAIIDTEKVKNSNKEPLSEAEMATLKKVWERTFGVVLSPEETEEVFKKAYMQGCEDAFDYNEDSNGGKSSTWTETWNEFKKTL